MRVLLQNKAFKKARPPESWAPTRKEANALGTAQKQVNLGIVVDSLPKEAGVPVLPAVRAITHL